MSAPRADALYLPAAAAAAARNAARGLPSRALDAAELGELELLLGGLLAPLDGYRTDDTLAPRLSVAAATGVGGDGRVALRDAEGVLIALLDVTASAPDAAGGRLVAGPVRGVEAPRHDDFPDLYALPPPPARPRLGVVLDDLVDTATLARAATLARETAAETLFVVPAGAPAADDRRHYARVRYLRRRLARYPHGDARLLLLPLTTRDAGGRRRALRALANLDCARCLLPAGWRGVPEAGAGGPAPEPHYLDAGPSEAPFADGDPDGDRALLAPRRDEQGFTVFFTGLSGSGKSTIANALLRRLLHGTRRSVTLLDGDRVRQHLSSELGFSRAHRGLNVARIAWVAAEIAKHGGVAICAPIAPYASMRADARTRIERHGGFVEVHVATALEVCERRDRKGLYAKARAGEIAEFTGISDPYEAPQRPELRIDAGRGTPEQAAQRVLARLVELGYLLADHAQPGAAPTPRRGHAHADDDIDTTEDTADDR